MLLKYTTTSFWNWLLAQRKFQGEMRCNGYYAIDKQVALSQYKSWLTQHQLRDDHIAISSSSSSFAIDYLAQMPEPLRAEGMYLVRTGSGNSIVFSSFHFPPPFMYLDRIGVAINHISVKQRRGYDTLKRAIGTRWNERTFIDTLHFSGAFDAVVKRLCGAKEYESGPSGASSACFPFYMKNVKKNKLVESVFRGTDDLDECLYPRNTNVIMPIEAKVSSEDGLGWHKLAFPCCRFIHAFPKYKMSLAAGKHNGCTFPKVIPIFCAFNPLFKNASIYVFPQISIQRTSRNGKTLKHCIVLNDAKQFVPSLVFKLDLGWVFETTAIRF